MFIEYLFNKNYQEDFFIFIFKLILTLEFNTILCDLFFVIFFVCFLKI